jgi:hypothetical protein
MGNEEWISKHGGDDGRVPHPLEVGALLLQLVFLLVFLGSGGNRLIR